ncbi:MAG: ribulose bisphosphate carboxylase small subunit [Chloroflexota bacterium]
MKTETFSYLPALSREQVEKQIQYFLKNGWVVGIEYSSQPGPSLVFWNWWRLPLFNVRTVEGIMAEMKACQAEHPEGYIRVTSYDNARQCQAMSFVAHRPKEGKAA